MILHEIAIPEGIIAPSTPRLLTTAEDFLSWTLWQHQQNGSTLSARNKRDYTKNSRKL